MIKHTLFNEKIYGEKVTGCLQLPAKTSWKSITVMKINEKGLKLDMIKHTLTKNKLYV